MAAVERIHCLCRLRRFARHGGLSAEPILMGDSRKTKGQLLKELEALHGRTVESKYERPEPTPGNSEGIWRSIFDASPDYLMLLDGAEMTMTSLSKLQSNHTGVAVHDRKQNRWILVDPTSRRIISKHWGKRRPCTKACTM